MVVDQFFKLFGIEFLIQNHDLLDILRDLTSCPNTLQLIDTLDELIELLKYLKNTEENFLKFDGCRTDSVNYPVYPDYLELLSVHSTASIFIDQAREFAQVIKDIIKLAAYKKRVTDKSV